MEDKNLKIINCSWRATREYREEFLRIVKRRNLNLTLVSNQLRIPMSRLSSILSGRISFSNKVKVQLDKWMYGGNK